VATALARCARPSPSTPAASGCSRTTASGWSGRPLRRRAAGASGRSRCRRTRPRCACSACSSPACSKISSDARIENAALRALGPPRAWCSPLSRRARPRLWIAGRRARVFDEADCRLSTRPDELSLAVEHVRGIEGPAPGGELASERVTLRAVLESAPSACSWSIATGATPS
jgi:hypothetical protein